MLIAHHLLASVADKPVLFEGHVKYRSQVLLQTTFAKFVLR